MNKLAEKLKQGLLIFDGAMGTEIYRRNFFVNASYEQLVLTQPKVISAIHRSYLDAGAEVLTTNTFNANSRQLAHFGLGNQTLAINQAAVDLAREVAGTDALIAASVGPVGESETPADTKSKAELLSEQLRGLSEADFILFESLRSVADVEAAIEAVSATKLPYVFSFAPDAHSGNLKLFMEKLNASSAQPTALGLNCGGGPEDTLLELEELLKLTKLPVIIQPNAGSPRGIDGRRLYMTSAEYFATYAKRYADLGAAAIGGCCGITPEHIAELSRTLKPIVKAEHTHEIFSVSAPEAETDITPLAERSPLGAKLAKKEFVRTIEITPPPGFDLTSTIEKAKKCRAAGIDAVNLPDGPRASARITPLATAIAIEREAGIATIPHCCCRDRSLLGLQAELLGYAGSGIHNLLFITGDPPKLGDYPFSSGVFDTDSIGLTKLQNRMNRGIDLGGKKLNAPTMMVVGVGADPNALDQERELRRLEEKVSSGADFIITQPIFSVDVMKRFLEKIAHLNTPVVAGIWPLASLRNAEFMRDEVPGVVVPEEIMRKMSAASDRDAQRAVGIELAAGILRELKPYIAGAQVSAPFGNVDSAIKVFASAEA